MEKTFENIIRYLFKIYLNRQPTEQEISYHISSLVQNGLNNKRKEFLECKELYHNIKKDSFPRHTIKYEKESRNKNLNKKIAICLSGHSRRYNKVFPLIGDNLVKELNADVFMHTWDTTGVQIRLSKDTVGPKPDDSKKIEKEDLLRYFEIKKIQIENNAEVLSKFQFNNKEYYLYCAAGSAETGYNASAEPKYIMSQLYSAYKSNELKKQYEKENSFKYDLVIKMRMDYCPNNSISNEEIELFGDKVIYVPNHTHSNHGHPSCSICVYEQHEDEHTSDVCDVYAYGSSEVMDHYCSLYEKALQINQEMHLENLEIIKKNNFQLPSHNGFNLVNIWKTQQHHKINCFYPERLLKKHLKGYRLLPSTFNGMIIR